MDLTNWLKIHKKEKSTCQNTCEDFSHIMKRGASRVDDLYELGFKIRAQLIDEGKYILSQKQVIIFKIVYLCITYYCN